MHDHDKAGHTGPGSDRITPARKPASAPQTRPHGLLGLQADAGNAAVVQMLRRAGHPWAQEMHQHSAGCSHQQTGHAQQPAVQRSAVHDVLRTSGRPLDGATRTGNAGRAMAAGPQAAPNLQRQVAPSHIPAPLPSVQRAYDHENPENPQNVMTTEHWERKAGVVGADGKATKEMVKTKANLTKSAKKNKNAKAGQARRLEDILNSVGPGLLRQLQGMPETAGKLELYRAMSLGEAQSILEYWGSPAQAAALEYVADGGGSAKDFKTSHKGMTVGAHLGDRGQAEAYHDMGGQSYQVLLRFTLKPGAHQLLFDPEYMALGPSYKTELIREANRRAGGPDYKNASANEGTLSGYIGAKAEENEPFSVAVAQGANTRRGREVSPSQLLFQLFVEDVNVVGNKSGTPLPREAVAV
ncbi:hypothetical protein [Streptomyces sp. GC420]|uniref:hypothetical protein n=1 Tax=Streptomyces sp. GC420 TaxID=2697568 RepID=UPI001FB80675|nr:hypothetical protein [Streptomyces sp. GC420]